MRPAEDPAVSALKPGHVAAVAAGNALEFYDFLTYGFFAAQIGRTFFPSTVPNASLLAALATFGVGFLMRPVGAFVIGQLADKAGRKPAMLTSFGLMGLAVLVLALIPPYSRIGVLAPVLAIACRLVQGFALGGEVGSSTAFLMEASDPAVRGRSVAFQFVGQQLATLSSGVVGFTLAQAMPDRLDTLGWRIAMLLGLVIVPFALVLRNRLAETLGEDRAAKVAPTARTPLLPRIVVIGVVLLAGSTTTTYLGNYMTTYATETLHMGKAVGFSATIVVGLCGATGALLGGIASDRFGRKPVMMIPWGLLALALIPLFNTLATVRTAPALLLAAGLPALATQFSNAAILTSVCEGLPRAIRGRALGLVYAVAISVFGGSTQFTVAWLTGVTHSPLAPAWYATAAIAISFVAMLLLPETAPLRSKKS
jgi:MFS family permease